MRGVPTSTWRPRLLLSVIVALLLTFALAPAAAATTTPSPVTWVPADSTYGVDASPFVVVPSPAPAGTGATSSSPGAAYGAGFWDGCSGVYALGFMNTVPTDGCLPDMAETELAATPLIVGVPLVLAFDKAPGQRVNHVVVVGDPDASVAIEPADPAALTAASRFTVRASVTDPVQSYSGDVGTAFGLIVDCSACPARDYQNSLFVTTMHWMDVDPATFTAAGLAGLSAHGSNGTVATFDGIFTPAFLTALGIADPAQVQGYVDAISVASWTGATFAVLGPGDGSLWPAGAWKYRVTNATWCTHSIMFGQLSEPAKPAVIGPKGVIGAARPTLRWKWVPTATRYEVRVYRGDRLVLKKAGVARLQWTLRTPLPRDVRLTWKVRGYNSAGIGVWSTAPRFRIL